MPPVYHKRRILGFSFISKKLFTNKVKPPGCLLFYQHTFIEKFKEHFCELIIFDFFVKRKQRIKQT